jgi:GAF domain-containing protein
MMKDLLKDEYAALHETGWVRVIADIAIAPIHHCHGDFLQSLQVRANLAVPILTAKGLWGLLIAHYRHVPYPWTSDEIERIRTGAKDLATIPCIQNG